MKSVVRKGDINLGGGVIVQGHSNITVNGKALGKYMSIVTPHIPCPFPPDHCLAFAAFPGSSKVTANGKRVLRVGDMDTCLHPRIIGSRNVVCG